MQIHTINQKQKSPALAQKKTLVSICEPLGCIALETFNKSDNYLNLET